MNTSFLTGTRKRTHTMGLHHWSEEDTILCFYITKFGFLNLCFKDVEDVSKFIGTTEGSFIKQSMNFRKLMGKKTRTLSDFSQIQSDVFDVFNDVSQYEFFKYLKYVLNHDQLLLSRRFKEMGKDFSNYKMVS